MYLFGLRARGTFGAGVNIVHNSSQLLPAEEAEDETILGDDMPMDEPAGELPPPPPVGLHEASSTENANGHEEASESAV